ncbi:porin family protein [Spirosoma aerophilum]
MKALKFFLALTLLPAGLAIAQTKPASTTQPASRTKPASSTVATPTNRQQELYDEHHGITRKPAKTPSTTPSTADRAQTQQPATTQPTMTTSQPERVASSTSGFRIGVRGGVTYPVFTEAVTGIDPAIGFVGGLTFNFGKGAVSFQPEINYTRYAQSVKLFGTTSTLGADVVEVPLFLKFSTGTYAGNRFFLNVGPYAAYELNISENGKTISIDGAKGRFGFGAGAGVGAALKAGPGHVTIEVRGLYPLGDIDNGFSTDSKTIFGQAALGYIFPLSGR